MPGAGGRDDEDDELADEEWTDAEDRDPFRDHKIARKNAERAYREAARHNARRPPNGSAPAAGKP